jgi:hypothetical protein
MKTHLIIKEILLMTTSSFSERQLRETDAQDSNPDMSPAEQLEAACWNGLLIEMLPEIMHHPSRYLSGAIGSSHDKKLFLWQVQTRKSYLWISMAECPPVQETWSTLDPHVFLCHQEMN